jgi:hypothetical protein
MQKAWRPQGSPLLYYYYAWLLILRVLSPCPLGTNQCNSTFLLPELSGEEITPCLDWLHLLFDH